MLYVDGWDGMGWLSLVTCLLRAPSVKSNICAKISKTRSCALRDDEAVYWVSIGHYEAVAVGN